MKSSTQGAALVALFSIAQAHQFLTKPQSVDQIQEPIFSWVPEGGYSAPGYSTYSTDGQWACHGIDATTASVPRVKMTVGTTEEFVLSPTTGTNGGGVPSSAIHGGGSCQFSINYASDKAGLLKPENWKVISSIEGGCVADATGNIPNVQPCADENGSGCLRPMKVRIPEGLAAGKATIAWTWFNNIGNREMYMNCVPVEISTKSTDQTSWKSLPQMFIANSKDLSPNCRTKEQTSVKFPDAGKNKPAGMNKFAYPVAPVAGCGTSSGGSSPAEPQPDPAPAPAPYPTSSKANDDTPAPTSAAPAPPANSPPSQPNNPAPPAPPAPSSQPGKTASPKPSSSSKPGYGKPGKSGRPRQKNQVPNSPTTTATPPAGTAGAVSCEVKGAIPCGNQSGVFCIGETQFANCDPGHCYIPQAMAAGTKCVNNTVGFARKRSAHVARHARRMAHRK